MRDQSSHSIGHSPARTCYSDRVNHIREILFWTLEKHAHNDVVNRKVQIGVRVSLAVLILFSLFCFVLETLPSQQGRLDVWEGVETVTTCIFTVEYLLRLWICDVFGTPTLAWVLRPINFFDLLSVLPWFLEIILRTKEAYWLRVLRVFRLMKMVRHSEGVQLMATALKSSLSALSMLVLLFLMGVVLFSSTVYFTEKLACPAFEAAGEGSGWYGLEDFRAYSLECAASTDGTSATFGSCCAYKCDGLSMNATSDFATTCLYSWQEEKRLVGWSNVFGGAQDVAWQAVALHQLEFDSIPNTMWWACVTMTTVGYGDMVPKSWVSKLVASVAMVAGMLIIAMPFAIVGTKFGETVAICEEPDADHLRHEARRLSAVVKLARRHGSSGGSEQAKSQEDQLVEGQLVEKLKASLQESLLLKQQISSLQELYDNLWTSVEHAMASLAYEGIISLQGELLEEPELHCGVASPSDCGSARSTPASIQVQEPLPQFCERSCWIFPLDSSIRRFAIRLTQWVFFDWFILFVIMVNSVILGMRCYYPYKEDAEPWQNMLMRRTELPFIILFSVECAIKVIARGFVLNENSYLREPWNWIDFVVVVSGLLSSTLNVEDANLSWLLTFRMLRPLRTLAALPGLRKLVNTIVLSLPGLKDVMFMAFFLLTTFGILGLHFWGGLMHRRCRLTSQPLHFTSLASDPDCLGWCFDNSSVVTITVHDGRSNSVDSADIFSTFCAPVQACVESFEQGRDYYLWPLDSKQDRFCGEYQCKVRTHEMFVDEYGSSSLANGLTTEEVLARALEPLGSTDAGRTEVRTWCGNALSDDDVYGPAAVSGDLKGVNLDNYADEVFSETFNWGITHYDQIGAAFLVIFQCITLEGWVDIMYMLQDAFNTVVSCIYFFLLILFGFFFLLNVTLAIVWDAFCQVKDHRVLPRAATEAAALSGNASPTKGSDDGGASARLGASVSDAGASDEAHFARPIEVKQQQSVLGTLSVHLSQALANRNKRDVNSILNEPSSWRLVRFARLLAAHRYFNLFILFIIVLNVGLLVTDTFPSPPGNRDVVFALNLSFNAIFIIECIVLHIALGPVAYWGDDALTGDGIIVLVSIPEIIITLMFNRRSSPVTALRTFRLLRIFKFANKFHSMKVLLKAGTKTLLGMRDFMLLLFVIICIFALVGQSFFGGRFMFDADGVVIPREEFESRCPYGPGGKPICVPRAHFDSFLWSGVTIFQILTGENWNVVMYDAVKACGWVSVIFFILVINLGTFVILNLFLAILMMNFELQRENIRLIEEQKVWLRQEKKKSKRVKTEQARQVVQALAIFNKGNPEADEDDDYVEDLSPTSLKHTHTGSENAGNSLGLGQKMWSTGWSIKRFSVASISRLKGKDTQPMNTDAGTGSGAVGGAFFSRSRFDRVLPAPSTEEDDGTPDFGESWRWQPGEGAVGHVMSAGSSVGDALGATSERRKPGATLPTSKPEVFLSAARTTGAAKGFARSSSRSLNSNKLIEPAPSGNSKQSSQSDRSGLSSNTDPTPKKARSFMSLRRFWTCEEEGLEHGFALNFLHLLPEKLRRSIQSRRSEWHRCCFVLHETNPIRKFCFDLVVNPRFDQVVMAFITLSSLLLMLQNPLNDPSSPLELALTWTNRIFTMLFFLEMLAKMMAFGVMFGPVDASHPAYLQSAWNILDFLIVMVSVIDDVNSLAAGTNELTYMKIFRIARLLRPLRIIARNENLKVVVKTIGTSLPELGNLLAFSALFYMIFGLLGVAYLKGSFYSCQSVNPSGGLVGCGVDETGVVPICIPEGVSGASLPFIEQTLEAQRRRGLDVSMYPAGQLCVNGSAAWQRPSSDTPICEVRCPGATGVEFCDKTQPWGYHAMQCTTCSETFCPNPSQNDVASCESDCQDHEYFCLDSGHANHSACVEECVAECLCKDHCWGLVEDAALCVEQGGKWINPPQNFDNLGWGIISLFEISTTEGWVDLMLASADARGPYKQPRRDENEVTACFFYFLFMMIGSFFVLNLCVGVIIESYHKQKVRKRSLMVTEAQAQWVIYQKALFVKKQFFLPLNLHMLSPTREHLIRVITSAKFEKTIMTCIILNTVVLAVQISPSPGQQYSRALDVLNLLFAVVFNVEAAMKLGALHWDYFREAWNIFDFVCVVMTDVFLFFDSGGVFMTIRIFRIARLFRLVRFLKGLNKLFKAFVLSVPKLFNVAFIMLLLIYLYAILGVNLFSGVQFLEGGSYGEYANFRSFPKAMTLLVRAMTGEGWNIIMHNLSHNRYYYESYMDIHCNDHFEVTASNFNEMDLLDGVADQVVSSPNQCGSWLAFPYFISFTLLVTFVILNLFIAVIFEGFEESSKSEIADLIQLCIENWKKYDSDNRMLVPLDKALDFIDATVEQLTQSNAVSQHIHLESRWDRHEVYSGHDVADSAYVRYNLRYVRTLALMFTQDKEVRFVVAVKAVIRRIICNGGLNNQTASRSLRLENLRELEALDRIMLADEKPPIELEKDLRRLVRLEQKQERAIALATSPSRCIMERFACGVSALRRGLGCQSDRVIQVGYISPEYSFLQEVAAAKIQFRVKEAFQRRRARNGGASAAACGGSHVNAPIARAAG